MWLYSRHFHLLSGFAVYNVPLVERVYGAQMYWIQLYCCIIRMIENRLKVLKFTENVNLFQILKLQNWVMNVLEAEAHIQEHTSQIKSMKNVNY